MGSISNTTLCALLIWGSLNSFAAEVFDQSGFFNYFEKIMQSKSYAETHPCNHYSTYQDLLESFEVHCDNNGFCYTLIISSEKEYKKSIFECNENEMILQSTSGDSEFYSKEEFLSLNKNYIKNYLMVADEYIGHLINFRIQKYKKAKMTMAPNTNNSYKLDVINVFGTVEFLEVDHTEPFILTVSSDVPAPMQVLRFRVGNNNIFRYLDFK